MTIELVWKDAGFSSGDVLSLASTLVPRLEEMRRVLDERDYGDEAASLILPRETRFLEMSRSASRDFADASLVVVVGIGGSNLGTMAVQEAVLGKFYNLEHPPRQLLFADTVDPDSIEAIVRAAKRATGRVVLNAVSKSGATTETIANFEVLLKRLGEGGDSVVVTTDEGSRFEKLADKMGFRILPIPKNVGGRYSVFSSVGLFPLALVDIDLEELLGGASDILGRCLSTSIEENPAALIASLLFLNLGKGISIHDHFIYSNDLESVGKWYRQLMGESVGKEWNASNTKRVFAGITPTVSIGSTDLHSMAQLYLGGPQDKFHRFVTVARHNSRHAVPKIEEFESLVGNIQGLELDYIMKAICKGVQAAFVKSQRPFIEISLPDKSERSLGQLLQMEMVEIMLLGKLLDVNPFDQPAVETYKLETREILRRSGARVAL